MIIWVVKIFDAQFFCVFFATSSSCLLLLLGPYHLCPLSCPSLHEMPPWYLTFLEEISSLPHSIALLYFLALITEKAFLISPWNSQIGISFLLSFAFLSLHFTANCKAFSGSHFAFLPFCISFFLGMVLIPVSCTMS